MYCGAGYSVIGNIVSCDRVLYVLQCARVTSRGTTMLKNYKWLIGMACILIATLSLQCSNEKVVTVPPDLSAPSQITDLTAVYSTIASVTLTWTAPGDDGDRGTAAQYDVRYATVPITEETWASAMQADGETSPKVAGETETFTVRGLESDVEYFFVVTVATGPDTRTPRERRLRCITVGKVHGRCHTIPEPFRARSPLRAPETQCWSCAEPTTNTTFT